MSTDIAVRSTGSALTIAPEQQEFTEKQVAILRQLGVQDASDGDLAVFFHQAKRTGLDPFARQIYMIGRRERGENDTWVTKQTIQTGIDGYRLVARRAADRAGEKLSQAEPLWCGKDMKWLEAWPFDEPPVAAKVVVYRDGEPFPGVAMYREFVQTKRNGDPTSMWSRMPASQLAKCAEALALRKAFPQDLAGIYTDEEMGQADRTVDGAHVVTSAPSRRVTAAEITGEVAGEVVDPVKEQPPPDTGEAASEGQMRKLHAILKGRGITGDDAVREAIGAALGLDGPIESRTLLTRQQADTALSALAKPQGGGQS